jgi:hypothetical protein
MGTGDAIISDGRISDDLISDAEGGVQQASKSHGDKGAKMSPGRVRSSKDERNPDFK